MVTNTDIWLGSGASLTLVPELDFQIKLDTTSSSTQLIVDATFSDNFRLVEDLYVGCIVDLYDNSASTTVPASTHIITSNDTTSVTISPAHSVGTLQDATDFMVIRRYGAPCPTTKTGSIARLNADNWLGLVESATFPNVEQEMKQLNINLGSSRNFTHQYKNCLQYFL